VENLKDRRSLAIKFLMPMIFLVPVLLPGVPAGVKVAMLPLAALLVGVSGSAIGLVRQRESNIVPRLALLPRSRWRMMLDYLGANVLMGVLQLAVPFTITLLLLEVSAPLSLIAGVALVSAVAAAVGIGAIIGTLADTWKEGHIYAALGILMASGAYGLFMVGTGSASATSLISPFSALSRTLDHASLDGILFVFSLIASTALVGLAAAFGERYFRA
jgi:hypothetical protein